MANQEHVAILKQGVEIWNQWRNEHTDIRPDLSNAYLSGADLSEADLSDADLHDATLYGADLTRAKLYRADLSDADLSGATLNHAHLYGADLTRAILMLANLSGADLTRATLLVADLSGAKLNGANLSDADLRDAMLVETDLSNAYLNEAKLNGANLRGANLSGADLTRAVLVDTNLSGVTLTQCSVYGISVWNVQLEEAKQESLIITRRWEPTITVDNLEVAQFIYLLLNNPKIRDVIDTIGQKGVLILGRFTPERKAVLDAIREKLRSLNFLPIVFDFERPTAHDFTETIVTLAGLSCFIIADITNPKSSPLELQATVPNYMTPFVPIIEEGEQPFAMFIDLQNKYRDWVLDTLLYDTPTNLVDVLERAIVKPALKRRAELLVIKAQGLRTRHIKDYS